MPDQIIQDLKLVIEKQLNWGSSLNWEQAEFDELSKNIQESTHINLSTTTLKRVWGHVQYINKPSISTLNTLSRFAGFENWHAFKNRTGQDHYIKNRFQSFITGQKLLGKNAVFTVSIPVFLGLSIWMMLQFTVPKRIRDYSKVKFDAKYTSKGLPNTVIFSFDMDGIKPEKLIIQESWDSTKRIQVNPGQQTATSVYYYPGYFKSKLIADGEIIKEKDIYIETDGWIAAIRKDGKPRYINGLGLLTGNKLGINPDVFADYGSGFPSESFFSYYNYKEEKSIKGSDFIFETSLRNLSDPGMHACAYNVVVLHFTGGVFYIPVTQAGCVGELTLMLMENRVEGSKNDLSGFALDIYDWQKIGIISKDNKVDILLNGDKVYTSNFKRDPGYFVGFSFHFSGYGEISGMDLKNDRKSVVFPDHS